MCIYIYIYISSPQATPPGDVCQDRLGLRDARRRGAACNIDMT